MDWADFCNTYIAAPDTITVEAYQGAGGYGDVYAAAAAVTPCVVEDTRRLVRVQTQDTDGREQVSSTTVYAPLDATIPAGSMVTVPSGRRARALAVSRVEAKGLPLPEHLEINLE